MSQSAREGDLSITDFHFLVCTPEGIEHFTEHHELTLFHHEDHLEAMNAAGFETSFDEEGLIGRGLYVGVKR